MFLNGCKSNCLSCCRAHEKIVIFLVFINSVPRKSIQHIPMERKKIDETNYHLAIDVFFKVHITNLSQRPPMFSASNEPAHCGQVLGIVLSSSLSFACRLFLQDLNLPLSTEDLLPLAQERNTC